MWSFRLRISKIDENTAVICIPESRLTRAQSVGLRCRIEKMRAFQFQRLIIEDGLYKFFGAFAPFTPTRVQGLGIRIGRYIDDIKSECV